MQRRPPDPLEPMVAERHWSSLTRCSSTRWESPKPWHAPDRCRLSVSVSVSEVVVAAATATAPAREVALVLPTTSSATRARRNSASWSCASYENYANCGNYESCAIDVRRDARKTNWQFASGCIDP